MFVMDVCFGVAVVVQSPEPEHCTSLQADAMTRARPDTLPPDSASQPAITSASGAQTYVHAMVDNVGLQIVMATYDTTRAFSWVPYRL